MIIDHCTLVNTSASYDTQRLFFNQMQGAGQLGHATIPAANALNNGGTSCYHVVNDNPSHSLNATYNYWYNTIRLGGLYPGNIDISNPLNKASNQLDFLAKDKYKKAKDLRIKGDKEAAKITFKEIVESYSESDEAHLALNEITDLLAQDNKKNEAIEYFKALRTKLKQKKQKSKLEPFADRNLLYWLQLTGEYKEAETLYDEVIKNNNDAEKDGDLLYRKALLLMHNLDRTEEAIPVLQQVAVLNNSVSDLAKDNLRNLNAFIPEQEVQLKSTPEATLSQGSPLEFALFNNYPNPFNPTTEIKYQLPQAANVTLVVYNIMGQEVARLVNEQKTAGFHSVKWDASNVASGAYIYKITAGSFTATKRMLLIK